MTKKLKKEKPAANAVQTNASREQADRELKNTQRERYKKPNFYKYDGVKDQLIPRLDGSESSARLAKDLGLSISTFYKYKALAAALHPGQTLMTLEEKIFKNKKG